MHKKTILMILDGWGMAPDKKVSAVDKAHTPFIDSLYNKYAHSTLLTHGGNVGLPDGQMGNSEVGHMNLGAGRIVYQDLAKINLAIKDNTLKDEQALKDAFTYARENNKSVHLLGLVSDGGVHSHIDHLKGLITASEAAGVQRTFIHAFTDGRDVDPKSGKEFIEDVNAFAKAHKAQLASVIGRYYAMDRDKRWERVKLAYDLIVKGAGTPSKNIGQSLQDSYDKGITDEFIEPIFLTEDDQSISTVKEGDVVIFFNFRTDRGRELTEMLSQKDFKDQETTKLDLYYVTMTNYDETFKNVHVVYDKDNLTDTLGETLAKAGKKQIRIAETEKYPHVTFFFNGGQETPFEGESRLLCPSPKVATYDLQPEMSAFEIRNKIIPEIKKGEVDFVCLNFANPDMVGHTGVMEAAIKACETVDQCTKDIVNVAQENDYTVIIIADHGNAETMINPDGSPNTAHTTNPVPIILVDKDIKNIKNGILADVAPTILHLLGVPQPSAMDRKSLV
ncbi:2,3-bisphosphoglycerate-independent phosphoglycerate mutase [Dokdonia sinensis]|uniref:2,3-bisphosphoglycerate-independent phosphoglycerate mutase n=1 Tax=Dokdonia sinensis TaxID=2479847 RepID=A0A3M0FU71_9FLAO|nr:2,3-bisphosphoglycerate-independent phosphoglycerate mutase [Dokdonia sinensis]RMB56340.1 2,3-bisphosphoglycerate-independent phosphoglycerate mutase [Dokdonia sinensis]